jgi:hypothetical protein
MNFGAIFLAFIAGLAVADFIHAGLGASTESSEKPFTETTNTDS